MKMPFLLTNTLLSYVLNNSITVASFKMTTERIYIYNHMIQSGNSNWATEKIVIK